MTQSVRPEAALAQSATAVIVVDSRRRIMQVNDAACALFGLGRDALLDRAYDELVSAASQQEVREALSALNGDSGSSVSVESVKDRLGRQVDVVQSISAGAEPGTHVIVLMTLDAEALKRISESERGVESPVQLTPRERQVLGMVALGGTMQSIGDELGVSVGTVRNHTRSARQKLRARSRSHAIALASAYGQLDLEELLIEAHDLPVAG